MKNMDTSYKPVKLLAAFTAEEWDGFIAFANEPMQKCRPQVKDIISYLHRKQASLPGRLALQKALKITPARLDDLMNKLLNTIHDFWASGWHIEISDIQKDRHILSRYSEKNLDHEYELLQKKILKTHTSEKFTSHEDQLQLYLLHKNISIHEKIHKGRQLSVDIRQYEKYLDAFYWIEKLKLQCELENRKVVLNQISEGALSPADILSITAKLESAHPFVAIYRQILLMLLDPSVIKMKSWQQLLMQFRGLSFTEATYSDTLTISHYLINIALMGSKKGDAHFEEQLIDLIMLMEEKGLLIERQVISGPIFKLAVSLGLKVGRIAWVEKFCRDYGRALSERNKNELQKYSQALILFYKKEYDEADRLLRHLDFKMLDVYLKINVRKLEIKIYVEHAIALKENGFPLLKHRVQNLRAFLLEKENLGIQARDQSLEFLSNLHKVTKVYHDSKSRKTKLARALAKENKISEQDWLLSLLK